MSDLRGNAWLGAYREYRGWQIPTIADALAAYQGGRLDLVPNEAVFATMRARLRARFGMEVTPSERQPAMPILWTDRAGADLDHLFGLCLKGYFFAASQEPLSGSERAERIAQLVGPGTVRRQPVTVAETLAWCYSALEQTVLHITADPYHGEATVPGTFTRTGLITPGCPHTFAWIVEANPTTVVILRMLFQLRKRYPRYPGWWAWPFGSLPGEGADGA